MEILFVMRSTELSGTEVVPIVRAEVVPIVRAEVVPIVGAELVPIVRAEIAGRKPGTARAA